MLSPILVLYLHAITSMLIRTIHGQNKKNQLKKTGTDNSIYELTSIPQDDFRPSKLARLAERLFSY